MVIATRKPLCNKRWSASPASQDLQLTQLRHPWVATKASCKSKKAGRAAVNGCPPRHKALLAPADKQGFHFCDDHTERNR
jgi:hypothetical protein